jgi:gas vesicle protein
MKNSGLFIGLGIGLLLGTAIGLYIASSDEDKEEFCDEVNSKVNKAKETIGKLVNEGLEKLKEVTEKVAQVSPDADAASIVNDSL